MWGPEHEKSFTNVKKLVTLAPVLTYFDVNKPLTIQCDSSEKGIVAVLLRDSRALHEAETRYAQIEKELLAIVWSLERFQ